MTGYNRIPMVYSNVKRMTLVLAAIVITIGLAACSSSLIPDLSNTTSQSPSSIPTLEPASTPTPQVRPTTTPAAAPTVSTTLPKMRASANIEGLPSEWQFLSEVFSKYMNIFGVNVFATQDTPDSKVLHASNVLAQYLDNDGNGTPDNPAVVNTMTHVNASIVMVASEDDMESVFRRVPERFHEMIDRGQLQVQDLYGEETDPPKSENRLDSSLEEILHLITSVGYGRTYPDVFGEQQDSTIARYMDNARGGHYEESRNSDCEDDEPTYDWINGQCALPSHGEYPKDAWYTYRDPTCDYACMVTEYFYWSLTTILGAQSYDGRCSDISDEWILCSVGQIKSKDPGIYNLLTDSQYALPAILPDGNYTLARQ